MSFLGRLAFPTACLSLVVGLASCATGSQQQQPQTEAPIGIVDPMGLEQAPILAAMSVERSEVIDGYTFWIGSINGHPVVNVGSGQLDESIELATYLLIKHFQPRLTVLSGTAGAQNPALNIGDVVVGGFAVDKSSIHYELGRRQAPYSGVEIPLTESSDIRGAVVNGYGNAYPTPETAKGYGAGPAANDPRWVFASALAASRQAVTIAAAAGPIGTTEAFVATGDKKTKGSVKNKIFVGVIGDANTWTEPMDWMAAQNSVYQTDVEENEGMAFAFVNAKLGVPWLIVRGISDTPWHPNASAFGDRQGVIKDRQHAFRMVHAARRAADVTLHLVAQLPPSPDKTPATTANLSRATNARTFGYVVAAQTNFTVTPVTEIRPQGGSTTDPTTMPDSLERTFLEEFTYRASR